MQKDQCMSDQTDQQAANLSEVPFSHYVEMVTDLHLGTWPTAFPGKDKLSGQYNLISAWGGDDAEAVERLQQFRRQFFAWLLADGWELTPPIQAKQKQAEFAHMTSQIAAFTKRIAEYRELLALVRDPLVQAEAAVTDACDVIDILLEDDAPTPKFNAGARVALLEEVLGVPPGTVGLIRTSDPENTRALVVRNGNCLMYWVEFSTKRFRWCREDQIEVLILPGENK
jgi:hypothetical protein